MQIPSTVELLKLPKSGALEQPGCEGEDARCLCTHQNQSLSHTVLLGVGAKVVWDKT